MKNDMPNRRTIREKLDMLKEVEARNAQRREEFAARQLKKAEKEGKNAAKRQD